MNANLIEKALALTGKTMEWIREDNLIIVSNIIQPKIGDYGIYDGAEIKTDISIEKFGWYLLSPGFINEYIENGKGEVYPRGFEDSPRLLREDIARAIYRYQSGNSEPLTSLLSKI